MEKGDALVLGSCSQKNALGWGVTRGRLCRNGDCVKSGKCLARSAFDAAAKLFPCKQNVYEHLTLTLDSDGSDAYVRRRLTDQQKRNEDPYLVRVLEPRRKTPHTQRCNEFSKSPIALLVFLLWWWFLVCSISLVSPRRLAQALKEAAAREQEQAAKAAGGGRSSFQV